MVKVSKLDARRFLLKKQMLWGDEENRGESNPSLVLDMIKKLECVQIDPVSVVNKNQHLTLGARIPNYIPEHLNQLLPMGKVFEYKANEASVIPIEDYPTVKPIRARLRDGLNKHLEKLDPVVQHVLDRLEKEGPLPSRAFKSEVKVHGYWDNKAPSTKETSLALNLLMDAGVIRVVERAGAERIFGIDRLTVPKDILAKTEAISLEEATQELIDKYIRAYRIFDSQDPRFGWKLLKANGRKVEIEKRVKKGDIIPVEVEDVKRSYYMLTEDVAILESLPKEPMDPAEGPIRFLPPLDNLLWRRERIQDFFDFSYKWEIYIPKEKRQYGAYTMPILAGDQLIGRIDPRLDREKQCLIIQLLQLEPNVKATPAIKKAIKNGLQAFAESLGATKIKFDQTFV